ncbi:MAG: adenylyl-sulfate kinase [Rhizobiaceae bacterium]|nr:adenylyl-sulfate kinase [Rhizobiaceae bacterium]
MDKDERPPLFRQQSISDDAPNEQRLISGHPPRILWLTGLSGAGKSTIANALHALLSERGVRTYVLDGDALRLGLNRDLGFSDGDRVENIRRVGEVARLMADAGLLVIVAVISPFRAGRQAAKALMAPGEFVEIFVDTPLEECMRRDPKGLYKRVRSGEIEKFTGVDSIYEVPEAPDIHLRTIGREPSALALDIINSISR